MGRRTSTDSHESALYYSNPKQDVELTHSQLRHMFDELEDYSPPLDLLENLTSSAPAAARRASLGGTKWWESRSGGSFGSGDAEKSLVRVLSGQEEIANLSTPKGIMITGPPGESITHLPSCLLHLDATWMCIE